MDSFRKKLRIYFRQTKTLTLANLKTRYRNTFVGFLWVVLNPALMFGAQSYAFHLILKINVQNYPVFLVSGLLPWIFFNQSVDMCTGIILNNARLFKSFPIHPIVSLSAQLIDNLINFMAAFFILLVPIALFTDLHLWNLLLFPLPLFILVTGVFGICWMLCLAQVFLQDIRFIVSFALNLLYFVTPVFYPESFIPANLHWVILFNPINYFIAPFRALIYPEDDGQFWLKCAYGLGIALLTVLLANLLWRKKRNAAYFNL